MDGPVIDEDPLPRVDVLGEVGVVNVDLGAGACLTPAWVRREQDVCAGDNGHGIPIGRGARADLGTPRVEGDADELHVRRMPRPCIPGLQAVPQVLNGRGDVCGSGDRVQVVVVGREWAEQGCG